MTNIGSLTKVKLGDIIGEYSDYYYNNNDLDIFDFFEQVHKDDNTIKGISLLYFIISILFLLIYPFFGLLSTIIFHNKLYSFLYDYAEKIDFYPSYFSDFFLYCKLQPKNFLGRLNLIFISLFLSLTTCFVFLLLINSRFIRQYNWTKLYTSLVEKGYQPKRHSWGDKEYAQWITVRKKQLTFDRKRKLGFNLNDQKYLCLDGNHRHITLLLIYGPEKEIEVKLK
jgi:hypothetical protein